MMMDFLPVLETPTFLSILPLVFAVVLGTLSALVVGFSKLRISPVLFRRFVEKVVSPLRKQLLELKSHKGNTWRPLPPGPTPWPIVGNLPEMLMNKPTFKWIHAQMKELNITVACIRLGNVHVIPVTSPEIALEFLRDNDSIFASRPVTMATEYVSRCFVTTALVPWGEQWKKMRRVLTSDVLHSAKLHKLLVKRNEEADNLVRFVYNQCCKSTTTSGSVVNVRVATRQYSGNVIRKLLFNRRYFGQGNENGGPGYEEHHHVELLFTVLIHLYSFILSDYVPWLRFLDFEGHEKTISEAMRSIAKYHDPIIDERVKQWKDGKKKEPEDLLDALILARNANGKPLLSVEEIKAQCMELMIETVDNPSNAAEWALAEMINQPELLKKAIEEIDRVVGKERLVQESDIPQLNFVKACLREAFRIHPIAPFNIPHVSNRDATIAGYFIPKGSHVLLSRVGLGRNPQVWEDPLKFKPERHMKEMGSSAHDHQVELTEPGLRFISFSRGRRGCVGVALGTEMSVMLLARLLQGFTWSEPSNEEKIDLTESEFDLFLAEPLHALAKPRLAAHIYPT